MNIKLIRQFQTARSDETLVVLEGLHAIKHALRFGGQMLEVVAVDRDRIKEMIGELAPDVADELIKDLMVVSRGEFEQLSPMPHPTGIMAIARRPAYELDSILSDKRSAPVVLLEQPRNLGNLGACVRVAAAAGAAGLVALGDSDPWNPQVVRGGAGLQFAVPVVRSENLPDSERLLVAIHPEGINMELSQIPARAILAFGTERGGLSKEILGRAEHRVRIPMQLGVSSLNLATAVAIVLYGCKK